MKIYISGKISGIEKEAKRKFESAEQVLNYAGWTDIVNPFKLPDNHDKTWRSYMKECINALLQCGAIYMLKNWEDSRGAIIEHDIAKAFDLLIFYETI